MRHQRHNHNGYQSSGPLAPPTTLGPDGIPRPTRGPQAGPVVGFNIRACCYGFCQCIYDMIVFAFCCGLCFWCIHCCCHDNDEDYDSRRYNDQGYNRHAQHAPNNTPYQAIPDPSGKGKGKGDGGGGAGGAKGNTNSSGDDKSRSLVINTTNEKDGDDGKGGDGGHTVGSAVSTEAKPGPKAGAGGYQAQTAASETDTKAADGEAAQKPNASGDKALGATGKQTSNPDESYMI